jgi:hypothetical protein
VGARLRTLLPPGGFSNLVGHHFADLDLASEALGAAARALPATAIHAAPAPGLPPPAETLREAGRLEAVWLHGLVGGVATPREPPPGSDLGAILAWLTAVRTVSLMVLRPLADRDLERVLAPEGLGPTTLRRLLADLARAWAARAGELRAAGALLGAPPHAEAG